MESECRGGGGSRRGRNFVENEGREGCWRCGKGCAGREEGLLFSNAAAISGSVIPAWSNVWMTAVTVT